MIYQTPKARKDYLYLNQPLSKFQFRPQQHPPPPPPTPKSLLQDNKMASTATNKLIVSIDFGTTFSGVVCGETALNPGPAGQQLPPVFREIQIWPNEHGSADGKRSKKVPTKLRYLDNPPGRSHGSVSDTSNFQWGFQIPEGTPEREILQWFKL